MGCPWGGGDGQGGPLGGGVAGRGIGCGQCRPHAWCLWPEGVWTAALNPPHTIQFFSLWQQLLSSYTSEMPSLSSRHGSAVTTPASIHEDAGSIPGLAQLDPVLP